MNKIKLFIASMLGAIALVFACVLGTRVNAAAYDYGTYKVTTTTNTNDTATWDYTGCSTGKTLAVGDTANGLIVEATTFKTHANGFLSITGGKWLIPVPSGSSGTIKVDDSNPVKTDRYYDLLNSSSEVTTHSTIKDTVQNGISFTSENIVTVNSESYLRLQAAGGELKCKKIIVTLTSGAFEASAKLYNVKYYDGTTLYHTEEVEENTAIKYYPYKMGYDCPKLYTDSSLETEFDSKTPITSDKDLYCNFIAWDSSLINDGTTLSLGLIAKFAYGYSVDSSNTVELKDTIFSLLPATGFEATNKAVSTFGNSTYAVKTAGSFSASNIKNGIAINPKDSGTLSMYVYSSSNRTCTMYESTDLKTEIDSGQSTGSSTMTLVSYQLEADKTYYFGGSGSLYIYYASFEAAATEIADSVTLAFDSQYDADGTAATKLRFIGTIEGLATTEYTKIETITFTFDFNGVNDRALSVTQLYLSITGYDQYAAASNKMYFVYQLDNINKTTYAGLKLTDCKLTVVFTDGSSKTTQHADITLPAFA